MSFAVAMVWRDLTHHSTNDYYLCMVTQIFNWHSSKHYIESDDGEDNEILHPETT